MPKLDAHPLLRQFHESVGILQWILLLIGLGLTAFLIVKNKEEGWHLIKISALTAVFFVLPILPWVAKNVAERGEFTVEAVTNGKKATPVLNIGTMKEQLKSN